MRSLILSRAKFWAAWLLTGWLAITESFALGQERYVSAEASNGSFPLVRQNTAAPILVDERDYPGVIRAAHDLQTDVQRVTTSIPDFLTELTNAPKNVVVIGSLGRSRLLDQLIRVKKIDPANITGQWESFFIQVVPQPWPGIDSALIICGSDQRGTIYGIYDLSEQMGISPWHYWGDAPAKRHAQLFVRPGKFSQGPPSVKYRGIFINDEAPALTGWVQEKFGQAPGWPKTANYGPGFYTNVFELMLRLRANYIWPAMWNNAFNEDDTNNPALANAYGIVMGTSHQEPMMRAQKEWDRRYQKTLGSWNYAKISTAVENFWREGIRRNRAYENIITLGLRGANDTPMADGGPQANQALLEKIIQVQRQIIGNEVNSNLTQVPQVWCLYKEVMDYYNAGMRVPDDVTLLWAEDNWGNVRRLPTAEERQRCGGAGIYYHFDYHGGPRNYQWINANPIPKIWDQLSLAKQYGADRIWIVNVGHLNKSNELPLEFFLHLAWDTSRWTNENLDEFTQLWAAREFGTEHAEAIAELLTTYTKFNGRRKPELLDYKTYSLLNYQEFETVVADYAALASQAQKISIQLAPELKDPFYSFVWFPIQASAHLNALYLAAAKNQLCAQQGRASANDFAAQTRALFAEQNQLTDHFNQIFAGGKWNHFMDQPYIGYTNWNEPSSNNLDAIKLVEIQPPTAPKLGINVVGSTETSGGKLSFDRFGTTPKYVEVFNAGKTPFHFAAMVHDSWIRLSESEGLVQQERRIALQIDWTKAPTGRATGQILFSGAGTNFSVLVHTFNPAETPASNFQGFIEADGYVAIEAEHYTQKTDTQTNRWIKIPHYGHTLSGMRADGPPETLAAPGKDSPSLEYKIHLFTSGRIEVETILGPTLSFIPARPLRYAVSFDDAPPQEVTVVPAGFEGYTTNPAWCESVKNNSHRVKSSHNIARPGSHTLKIWMIDPAVVLEKIIVHTGEVEPSYLGPPESNRISR